MFGSSVKVSKEVKTDIPLVVQSEENAKISVAGMLVHNNGIYSVSNHRIGEQTARFLPHPKI